MRSQMIAMALRGRRSSGIFVSISDDAVSDVATYPDNASATFTLSSTGTMTTGQWLWGSTNGALYECYATLVGGTLSGSSSATGSWLALSSSRSWSVTRATLGDKEATITVQIRDAATQTVQDTATIELTAEVVS